MPRVMHFEISAEEPERAAKFYAEAFGWKVQKWESPMDYWMLITGDEGEPGINGGMMKKCDEHPMPGTVNTITVASVDEYVGKVEAAGGKIIVPKMAIPTIGYIAYFQDTEGNMFGLMEPDTSAK